MSEILDTYAAEAQALKYRDMAATEFLSSHGYKWEQHHWQAPDGLTPRQLAEQRSALLEALVELTDAGEEAWDKDRPCLREARAAIALAQGDAA